METQIAELANCPVCMELLLDARFLDCGHTFCLGCLRRLPREEGGLFCPICRHQTRRMPLELKKNIVACQLSQHVQEGEQKKPLRQPQAQQQPLRFHWRCGREALLSSDCLVVERHQRAMRHAIAFSSRPLATDELFEVALTGTMDEWLGGIKVGVCGSNPEFLELPASLRELQKACVVVDGQTVWQDGTEKDSIVVNLDTLVNGDTVGLRVSASGALEFFVNNFQVGSFKFGLRKPQWAVVDLYAKAAKVSLVTERAVDRQTTDAEQVRLSENEATSETAEQQAAAQRHEDSDEWLKFDARCGRSVELGAGRKSARRAPNTLSDGVLMSNRPLFNDELFEVQLLEKMNERMDGLNIGVCALSPTEFLPSSIAGGADNCVVLSGNKVFYGREQLDCQPSVDLDSLQTGDRVGVRLSANGDLDFLVNNRTVGVTIQGVHGCQWAIVDLHGDVTEIVLVKRRGIACMWPAVQQTIRTLLPASMQGFV